jgi:hypothetical protein
MNNLVKKIIGYLVLFLIVIGLGVMLFKADYTKKTPQKAVEELAACLGDKGATMYGAEWCSFCKKQKDMFGVAFKKIQYVECPDNQKACTDLGIAGYPTWIFANGEKNEGMLELNVLAQKAGCEYNQTIN